MVCEPLREYASVPLTTPTIAWEEAYQSARGALGLPTDELTEGVFQSKNVFKAKLKEIGLPFAAYYTGLFTDFALAP